MENEEFNKEIENLRQEYERVSKLHKYAIKATILEKTQMTPKRMYIHEVSNSLCNAQAVFNIVESDDYDEETKKGLMDYIIPSIKASFEKENLLEKMVGFSNFSKEEIISESPNSIRPLVELDSYSYENPNNYFKLDNSKEKQVVVLGDAQIYLKPEAIATFISTNLGNAVKWAPEESKIYVKIAEENENIKINIENLYGNSPVRKIGQGHGLGTKFTEKILNEINGKKEFYETSRINSTNDKIWGMEYIFPKKP